MEEETQNNTEMESDEETKEVEVLEISLNESEIDEFVNVLNELKANKGEISFDISDDTELLIHYEEEESEGESEEEREI